MTQLDMFQTVTSLQPDTHANPLALPETDEVKRSPTYLARNTFHCSIKKPTWAVFENTRGHISLGLDTVLSDLEGASTPQGHSLFRLVPRTHPTTDLDYSSLPEMWPTLTVQDAKNNGGPSQHKRKQKPLNAEIDGPLNPIFTSGSWDTQ